MTPEKEPQASDFLALPYSNRQLLAFVDDEVWRAQLNQVKDSKIDKVDWIVAAVMVPMGRPELIASLAAKAAFDYIEAYRNARQNGVAMATVPLAWHSELNLLPGHPRRSVLYGAHPTDARTYFPIAEFHRLTFEHKFSELVSLLMHLGAKEIEVEHQRGWGRDFAVDLAVNAMPEVPDIGAKVGQQKGQKERLLYHAEYSDNESKEIPEGMVWFPHEPTWKQVADGRLKFGLKKFSLQMNYLDDYGVNAGLKVKVEKAGLDLGGTFKNHESTSWSIKGRF